jgi:2-desacetyl-2-hydroxyethyl bacteriochlorophyllide A dehydrogenase
MNQNIKKVLKAGLSQLGISVRDARDASEWLRSRGRAVRRGRGLLRGKGIVWSQKGYTELVPIEVPRPGRGEVAIDVHYSVVSPGTERALLRGLTNARISYPFRPGYSLSGHVVEAGPGVMHVRAGDKVACRGVPHQSLVTVDQSRVFRVPENVSLRDAAMIELGIISGWGVTRAEIPSGARVCVVGLGPIGALAQRIAAARGAGDISIIATSRLRQRIAESGGAVRFLVTPDDDDLIADLGVDRVIEASGEPAALFTAAQAAGQSARIVLLGSTRAETAPLPMTQITSKELELVGAHVITAEGHHRAEGQSFVDLLADGALQVADLLSGSVDPRDAGVFYRRFALAGIGAPVFDWENLSADERVSPGRLLALPEIPARGISYASRPHMRPTSGSDLDAPFDGAKGHLRLAIIGCGEIAVENAAAIAAAPNTTLAAVYDVNQRLADDLARRHGAHIEPTLESLLGREDVDAVVICVPHHLHAPIAIAALEAGKHVVVEKPMANDLRSAATMLAAAKRARRQLSVCFPMRYESHVAAARRLIEHGGIGELAGASLTFLVDKPASYWAGGYTGRAVSSWRLSRAQAGGGVLIMNVSHHLDLLQWLTGLDVEDVSASAVFSSGREVEDGIVVAGHLAGGGTLSLNAASTVAGLTREEIRFWGDCGHLELAPACKVFPLRGVDGFLPSRWQSFGELPKVNARAVFFSRFATAIHDNEPCDSSAESGLAVQALIEAIYKSAGEGVTFRPHALLEDVCRAH